MSQRIRQWIVVFLPVFAIAFADIARLALAPSGSARVRFGR
jgi:hypothetical protein